MIRNAATCLMFLASSALAQEAELPIQKVVLYKHGIGYFERQGVVQGSADVTLHFSQDQMSDVLKSLTVLDRGGGRVAAIAYDSQKPPDRLLAEFSFDLNQDDIQQSLLRQLRGARVSAEVAGRGAVAGAVLGLDSRAEFRDGATVRVPRVTLLTDDGEMVSADLFDLRTLRFDDRALAAEVGRYLEVLRRGHKKDEKSVRLRCEGEGARPLFASYAVEQPVWKASYRLVLFGSGDGPLLQGWAVVDNTTDEDWNDVSLSLVAGLPISFRHDLYTPRYRDRPELVVEETAVVAVDKWVADADMEERAEDRRLRVPAAPGEAGEKVSSGAAAFLTGAARKAADYQPAEAVTREIGDLLEYRIDHAVTIPRNSSALLPIASDTVEGGKVALYDEASRAQNPMAAVRLTNTTGLTLEGGPLTVLEDDTYAGESLLDTLKPDEKRYVPFGVDLGVKATTQFDSENQRVHRVSFVRGQMYAHYLQLEKKTYSFDNRNTSPRTIVVVHRRRNGYELREPAQPAEMELDLYRFELTVGAGQKGSLAVVESRDLYSSYQLTSINDETIGLFLNQRILNPEAEAMLRKVAAMQAEVIALNRQASAQQARLAEIDKDQSRIRQNLQALGGSAEEKDLRLAYVNRLAADEATMKEIREQKQQIDEEARRRQAALEALLADFALDYEVR